MFDPLPLYGIGIIMILLMGVLFYQGKVELCFMAFGAGIVGMFMYIVVSGAENRDNLVAECLGKGGYPFMTRGNTLALCLNPEAIIELGE